MTELTLLERLAAVERAAARAARDGRDGRDGIDGIGIPGANGADGKDGRDGKDADPALIEVAVQRAVGDIPLPQNGRDGKDGRDGRDGVDGKDGERGPKGEPGKDGRDGLYEGIAKAAGHEAKGVGFERENATCRCDMGVLGHGAPCGPDLRHCHLGTAAGPPCSGRSGGQASRPVEGRLLAR